MKRPLFRLAALLPVLVLFLGLAGCAAATGNQLVVGVKGDVPNFGLYDAETGNYSGMEIELAELLSSDLGYAEPRFVTVAVSEREDLLNSGRVDMIIATYSITAERQAQVDFTDPYYRDCGTILVENSSLIASPNDLKGCSIGCLKGSATPLETAVYLAQIGVIPPVNEASFDPDTYDGPVTFRQYDSYNALSEALEWGEVDAMVGDRSIVMGYKDEDRTALTGEFAIQDYGIATKKNSALSAQLSAALAKRIDDGTLDMLINKWGN